MNPASTALSDLAYALHDACSRFTPPLHPDPDEVARLCKSGKRLHDAWREAPMVPRRMEPHEIERFEMFQQTWGSTALGLGGMGGNCVTTANTTVVFYQGEACVYFGSRFAYRSREGKLLNSDIAGRNLAAVMDANKYQLEN